MRTLYVIGNGFDLHHELPTSYENFYDFAHDELNDFEEFYQTNTNLESPWHDFENSLGQFNWENLFEIHNEINVADGGFKMSDVYGLEDFLSEETDRHVEKISQSFKDWVNQIDISTAKQKLNLEKEAVYLTFNYTQTLQSIYKIDEKNIIHIHGSAKSIDHIIFGHGETWVEEPELDENGDSNRYMLTDAEAAAKRPFYLLKKPVDENIQRNRKFFDSLTHIEKIIVLGHSLNEIDLPYLQAIAERAQSAKWILCLYSMDDAEFAIEQISKCGPSIENIYTCTYSAFEDAQCARPNCEFNVDAKLV